MREERRRFQESENWAKFSEDAGSYTMHGLHTLIDISVVYENKIKVNCSLFK